MSQSKKGSLLEALANLVIGGIFSFVTNLIVFAAYGWELSTSQNFQLFVIYSVVSVVRSYLIRRLFNRIKL